MQYGGLIILFVLAVWDLKEQTVPIWLLIILTIIGVLAFIEKTAAEKMYALFVAGIIGILGMVLIKRSQCMGMADVWTLAVCACMFSAAVFSYGLLITGVLGAAASGIIYFKTKDKERRIPFLPFVFAGILIGLIGEKIIWS